MSPKVTIIILNWNGWLDTIECLESLFQINYNNYQVILIDNDSKDNSIYKIKEFCNSGLKYNSIFNQSAKTSNKIIISEFNNKEIFNSNLILENIKDCPSNIILIKNDKNYGFAEGNNIGIEFALNNLSSDYILLLNNDTIVEKDFLNRLVDSAESNEKIGVIGPKIYYYDFKGQKNVINFLGGKINWYKYPGYHHIGDKTLVNSFINYNSDIIECDWITGAALMFKTDMPIKYLDKQYFFGCEDVDFCLKLNELSYKSYVNPNSYIWHKIGRSRTKRTTAITKSVLADFSTNYKLLKHYNKFFILIMPFFVFQMFLGMLKLLFIQKLNRKKKSY